MSQTAQSKPGQGGRGRGPPVYGRGPPGGAKGGDRPRRPRREPEEEVWVPKTILGQKVASGEIKARFGFVDFSNYQNYGIPFSKLLFHLSNISGESDFLEPSWEHYFNKEL